MENATDALQMAFAVFVFVLALSISINAFGEARQTTQIILDSRDREYDYTYVEDNGTTQRIVGIETIIPSIYKAYKENYKIVFKNDDRNGFPLYDKSVSNNPNDTVSVCSIDLETDVIGSDEQKEKFIKAWLYGTKYPEDVEELKISGIFLNARNDFYRTLKGQRFKENLGVYYQEEVQGKSDVSDANKNKKRVITYTKFNTF